MTDTPDIPTLLRQLATGKTRPIDISGEPFGHLVPRIPVGICHRNGIIWRCDCTKCGTNTRDFPQKYLRQRLNRARAKGRECTLACEACTAAAPRSPRPAQQQKWATPQEKARSRRSSRFDPEPIRVPTGDLELVVDGKVMARGSREDDWGRLQRALGGEVRPVMRKARSEHAPCGLTDGSAEGARTVNQ